MQFHGLFAVTPCKASPRRRLFRGRLIELKLRLICLRIGTALLSSFGFSECSDSEKAFNRLQLSTFEPKRRSSNSSMTSSDRRLTPAALRSFQLTRYQVVNEKSKRDGLSPILAASANGHLEVVRCLVKNGANINDVNPEGQTPLILAAKNGYQPLLRLLVNYGANLDIQDVKGRTALMHALTEGRLELARCLMGAGANQAPVDRDGKTALFVAAEWGHVAIVEHLLIEKTGADLSARDRQGRTVLMMLARAGKAWPMYKYISETKLRELINDRDSAGYTPLLHAAEAGKFSMGARLIKWGAKVTAVTDDGRTVIMLACQRPQISCATDDSDAVDFGASTDEFASESWDQLSFVASMLQRGVAIDAVDDKGRTALFYAAEYAELKLLQHLLSAHASALKVDSRDSAGNTILHAAARMGRDSVVRYLSSLPVFAGLIDQPNSAGETPLFLAIMSKSASIVRSLIECGASLDKANRCSKTPLLCVACENGAEDTVAFLLEVGFHPDTADSDGVTALMTATRSDHIRIVERLLTASANVNRMSKKGVTALTLAVQTVNIPMCKLLLSHKANPKLLPEGKSDCKTLCSIAATLDSIPLLKLLVEFCADPFQKDSQSRNALYYSVLLNRISPLKTLLGWSLGKHMDDFFPYEGSQYTLVHIAAERGSVEVLKQLLNGMPCADIKSSRGETPLHIACRRQDLTIAAMLSLSTATRNVDIPRDSDQFTALMVACQLGNEVIALDLIKKGADVNRRLADGTTALILAMKGDNADKTPMNRLPLADALLKRGAKFDTPADQKLLGDAAYNLLKTLEKPGAATKNQNSAPSGQQAAQSSANSTQSKPKTVSPMTLEERLKAKLKKKQLQLDPVKTAETEAKKTEPFSVRAKKVRDEVQRKMDHAELSAKRISSMVKKYVEVTALPEPKDQCTATLAKEMKKQDVTRLYKRPFMLSQEQMQQNPLVREFSKKMDKIREEIVRKFEENLDKLCRKNFKSAASKSESFSKLSDSSESHTSDTEFMMLSGTPRKERRVRWHVLYQLKYDRKDSKLVHGKLRDKVLGRLAVLKRRCSNKRRRYCLPPFWEAFRLRNVHSDHLAPRMRWLMEAAKLSDAELVAQFNYVRLEGIAAGVHSAAVWWQPLPAESESAKRDSVKERKNSRKTIEGRWKAQLAQLRASTNQHCNLLVRCGQTPTKVKIFNEWKDRQMQLDLGCSLQPDLFHLKTRSEHDRLPDIIVKLTVDTRYCLWDSRELRLVADSLVGSLPNASPELAATEAIRQRQMLSCLVRRRTYQECNVFGGSPKELEPSSEVASLHPTVSTKLLAVALHVGLARSTDAAYSVYGDDVLLYHQPSQKELKQLLGLLGRGRIKLIEARRFNN